MSMTFQQRLGLATPVALGLLLGFSGCQSTRDRAALHRYEFKQPHMGTLFTLTLYAPDEASATRAAETAGEKIAALEKILSDYDPESELMQLCAKPFGQPVPISPELFAALKKAQHFAEISDGAFDCTIGPVIRLWRRTRRTGVLPSEEQLARARAGVGWRKLVLDERNQTATLTQPNMQLDLGGIGKGYAADKALAVLGQQGFKRALVAASGDIAAGDAPPGQSGWSVGIGELDSREGPAICTVLLRHAAVSTAGDSEQFVEIGGRHYSHILDPHTGLGLTNRLQVTVFSRHATDTDALGTTLRVLDLASGLKLVDARSDTAALFQISVAGDIRIVESARWKEVGCKWSRRR